MLFTFGGDCFPEVSAGCPSDHERAMSLVWVALGAVALNGAGLFVLAWLHARGSSPR
jgi:hypothetical protein